MNFTKNNNLKKPAATEGYNIKDFNDNADTIDELLGKITNLSTKNKSDLVAAINELREQNESVDDNKTDRLEVIDYRLISDLPSAYKYGLTVFRGSSDWVNGAGFGSSGSHVLVVTEKADDYRIKQTVSAIGEFNKIKYRIGNSDRSWGGWQEIATANQVEKFGLGVDELRISIDLNLENETSVVCTGPQTLNRPTTDSNFNVMTVRRTALRCVQIAWLVSGGIEPYMYIRIKGGDPVVFGEWRQIAKSNDTVSKTGDEITGAIVKDMRKNTAVPMLQMNRTADLTGGWARGIVNVVDTENSNILGTLGVYGGEDQLGSIYVGKSYGDANSIHFNVNDGTIYKGHNRSQNFALIETGTWTPVYSGESAAGRQTNITRNNGRYFRINGLVFLFGSSVLNLEGATGSLIVGGIPFSTNTDYFQGGIVHLSNLGGVSFSNAAVRSSFRVYRTSDNAQINSVALPLNKIDVSFNIIYKIN